MSGQRDQGGPDAYRIGIAGAVRVHGPTGDARERTLGGRQGRVAFVRLVAARQHPLAKEDLADALWPDALPATWDSALRTIVSKIRAFVMSAGLPPDVVTSAFGCYQLQVPAEVSVDIEEAMLSAARAERALADGEAANALALATAATSILAHPVLPAESGEWLEQLRSELFASRLRALDTVAAAHLAQGRPGPALAAAEEAIGGEPYRESAHRLAMAAHAAAGSRGEALRAYERCRRLLAEELGVRPAPETESAYLTLLGDAPEAGTTTNSAESEPRRPLAQVGSMYDVPFVGRQRELGTLVDALTAAKRGEAPRLLLIAGEAGAGKTRLIREAVLAIANEGVNVYWGHCDEDHAMAYQPFVQVLSEFTSATPTAELGRRLGHRGGELVRLCPDIATRWPDAPAPLHSDAETERYLLHQAVAEWLGRAAQPNGLVVVLDDLHWTEPDTIALLRSLLVTRMSGHLVIVGLFRADEIGDGHPFVDLLADVPRVSSTVRIDLTGLARDDVVALVNHIDACGDHAHATATAVHDETDGNPLFVVELARHLAAEPARERTSTDRGDLPTTISDVIARRVARLPNASAQTLRLAAVVGPEFHLCVVRPLVALDDEALITAIEDGLAARLVEEVDIDQFRFSHAVVRRAIYQQVSATRRARLHARVGTILEQVRPDDVAGLAYHYAAAGPAGPQGKALEYAVAAGALASERLAWDRAASFYRDAVGLAERDPGLTPRALIEVRIRLGEALRDAGDLEWRDTLLAAGREARDAGYDDELERAVLANTRGFWSVVGGVDEERLDLLQSAVTASKDGTATQARLQILLANECIYSANRAERFALADAALRTARSLGDDELLIDVLTGRLPVFTTAPTLDTRVRELAELTALAERRGDPRRRAMAALWGWSTHLDAGNLEMARQHLARAERLSRELHHPTLLWMAANFRATDAVIRGDLPHAEQEIESAYARGVTSGQPDAAAWYGACLGLLRITQGRIGELADALTSYADDAPTVVVWRAAAALAHLELGRLDEARRSLAEIDVPLLADSTTDVFWLMAACLTTEVAVALESIEPAGGRQLYDAMKPFADQIAAANVSTLGSVERYLGLLAWALGNVDRAVEHLAAAIRCHEQLGAPFWLAQTQLDLADVLRPPASREPQRETLTLAALELARSHGFAGLARRATLN